MLFGYAQMALNADATFEFCPPDCNKGLLPTLLLWVKTSQHFNLFGEHAGSSFPANHGKLFPRAFYARHGTERTRQNSLCIGGY